MEKTVVVIPPSHIHFVWDNIENYIDRSAAECHGDVDTMEVKSKLLDGSWILYVAITDGGINGACVVSFANRINHRAAFVVAIGGRLMVNKELFAQLCALLKEQGATIIEGAVRPSLARLYNRLGFIDKSIVTQYLL